MREQIIRDDLTHELISESDLVTVEFVFGDTEGKFEGTQASVDALTAMFRDHDSSALAALLPRPEPKDPTSPKPKQWSSGKKHGNGDHAKARAWCQITEEGKAAAKLYTDAHGKPVPINGRMPLELVERYRQSHLAKAA